MTHAEFVEWMAFYGVEPFGGVREDIHAAQITSVIANANRKPKSKAKRVEKFVPDWWKSTRDPKSLEAKFRAFTANIPTGDDTGDGDGDENDSNISRQRGGN